VNFTRFFTAYTPLHTFSIRCSVLGVTGLRYLFHALFSLPPRRYHYGRVCLWTSWPVTLPLCTHTPLHSTAAPLPHTRCHLMHLHTHYAPFSGSCTLTAGYLPAVTFVIRCVGPHHAAGSHAPHIASGCPTPRYRLHTHLCHRLPLVHTFLLRLRRFCLTLDRLPLPFLPFICATTHVPCLPSTRSIASGSRLNPHRSRVRYAPHILPGYMDATLDSRSFFGPAGHLEYRSLRRFYCLAGLPPRCVCTFMPRVPPRTAPHIVPAHRSPLRSSRAASSAPLLTSPAFPYCMDRMIFTTRYHHRTFCVGFSLPRTWISRRAPLGPTAPRSLPPLVRLYYTTFPLQLRRASVGPGFLRFAIPHLYRLDYFSHVLYRFYYLCYCFATASALCALRFLPPLRVPRRFTFHRHATPGPLPFCLAPRYVSWWCATTIFTGCTTRCHYLATPACDPPRCYYTCGCRCISPHVPLPRLQSLPPAHCLPAGASPGATTSCIHCLRAACSLTLHWVPAFGICRCVPS